MKNTLKGYFLGVLSTVMLLACVTYAASTTKTIDVLFGNIKVYKDGAICELKDANGTTVEPFIYNGTTYMPVRATANLAGMDVTWDGATKSVNLWDNLTLDDTFLMEVCPPYQITSCSSACYSSKGESFLMGGKKYTNGLKMKVGEALFNLDRKYKSIDMTIGPIDGFTDNERTVSFIVDGKNIAEYKVNKGDYPKKISVPLNYGLQLKIFSSDGYMNTPEAGLGNIIVH